jgi:hypothetical protein
VFGAAPGIHIDGSSGSSRNNDLTATPQNPGTTPVQPGIGGTAAPVLSSFGPIPAPLIAGCCPTTAGGVPSNPGLTTSISGTGFNKGVTVQVGITSNGTNTILSPDITQSGGAVTFVSSTSIQVTIPPQYLAVAGFVNVTATNPSPSAGPSNALSLTVFNQAAIVTSLSPDIANVLLEPNSPPLKLTATGFNFKPGARMNVGGTLVPLDPTQPQTLNSISGLVPSSLVQVGGTVPVTVTNPDPVSGTPTSVPLNLLNLPPVLLSVQPTNGPLFFDTTRSSEPYNAGLTVNGANFSSVSIFEPVSQCAPIAISPRSATVAIFQKQQFTAYLNGLAATSGQVTWTVTSSASSGSQGSVGQIDTNGLYTAPPVVPTPATVIVQVTSVSDSTKFDIATVTITQASTGAAGSAGALGATIVNSHEAILSVPITCAGNYLIDVRNPQPGGGVSQKVSFTVNPYQQPATPTITSFDPPTAPGLNVPFTLTINGSGFEVSPNHAYVSFGGTILFPKSLTSSTVVVDVPGYLITEHGYIPVAVVSPDYGPSTGSSPVASFPVF